MRAGANAIAVLESEMKELLGSGSELAYALKYAIAYAPSWPCASVVMDGRCNATDACGARSEPRQIQIQTRFQMSLMRPRMR